LIAGCGGDLASAFSLSEPVQVIATGPLDNNATLGFHVVGGTRPGSSDQSWRIEALSLVVENEGQNKGRLLQLVMQLGDVDISGQVMPPNGLSLRDLRLDMTRAPAKMTITESDDDELSMTALVPLQLDWKLRLPDGSDYSLGPVATEPLSLQVTANRVAGALHMELHASCPGECWSLPYLASVTGLSASAGATARLAPVGTPVAPAIAPPGPII
jgi:hypothetical protein